MKPRRQTYPETTPDAILLWWSRLNMNLSDANAAIDVLQTSSYDPALARDTMRLLISVKNDMKWFPRAFFMEDDRKTIHAFEEHLASVREGRIPPSRDKMEDRAYVYAFQRADVMDTFEALELQFEELRGVVEGADWFSKLNLRRRATDYPRGKEASEALGGTEWDGA